MSTTQTYANLTAEQKTFYDRLLLKRLLPNLVFAKYGQKKSIPSNEGDTVNFRRFNSLLANTTALTEGVTPAGTALNVSAITATVSQYGDFIKISDKLKKMGIDAVLTESTELLAEQAAETIDEVVRNVIVVGTNVQYAGGRANSNAVTATDVLTASEIAKAVRTLRKKNAKPHDGKFFIGLVDPEVAYDLMYAVDENGKNLWQDVSKYSGGTAIMEGEIGKIAGVRFIETTKVKVTNNTASTPVPVHSVMIIGKDAYGVVDVEGTARPEMIAKGLGSAGTSDPLNQIATAGWKAAMTAVRLNELSMIRIECATTV